MGLAAAAGITAVGSITGGVIASNGAKSAANAETAANNAAIGEQRRQFDITQANEQPWLQAGQGALHQQMDLLGLGGQAGQTNWTQYLTANPDVAQGYAGLSAADKAQFPTPEAYAQWHYQHYGQSEGRDISGITSGAQSGAQAQQTSIDQLRQSPLYQSLFRNGQDTLLNASAATGGLRGGNTASSLANFGSDTLAQVIQQQLANLGGISGNGMSSAGQIGQLGANSSNVISNLLAQSGQARSGGILAGAGAQNNAIQGIAGQLGSLVRTPGLFGSPLQGSGGIVMPSPGLQSSVGTTMNANSGIF